MSKASRLQAIAEEIRTHRPCGFECCEQATNLVPGEGDPDAAVVIVGEAPGANEDRQGRPFVGAAGRTLAELLAEAGLAREDVFITNVVKCRPPGNRDPQPAEIDNCQGWLLRQVELIEPKVICTLGNFSTKLLRGDPTGITRLHGRDEEHVIGLRRVRLLPLFHPAAALYTASMLETLRSDFARIPDLLALPMPDQPDGVPESVDELLEPVPEPAPEVEPSDVLRPDEPEIPAAEQITLF